MTVSARSPRARASAIAFEKYAERPRGYPVAGPQLAAGCRRSLVSRRRSQRRAGRTGFAHLFEHMMFTGSKHVPRGAADKLLEAARRQGFQCVDLVRPHQLLRYGAVQSAGTGAVDTRRPHGLPARLARPDGADQSAGRRAQRAAAVIRERALRHRRRSDFSRSVPAGPPVPCRHHRLASRTSSRRASRTCAIFSSTTIAEQRHARPSSATSTPRRPSAWCRSTSARSSAARPCRRHRSSTPRRSAEKRVDRHRIRIEFERLDLAGLRRRSSSRATRSSLSPADILAGGKSSRLYKKLVYDLQLAQDVSASQDPYALTSIFRGAGVARSRHTAAELQPLHRCGTRRDSPPSRLPTRKSSRRAIRSNAHSFRACSRWAAAPTC